MSDDERKHLEGLDEQTERERWEEFHTGTDRVELTEDERERVRVAWRGPWGDEIVPHAPDRMVAAVGSIVAARLQALTTERDKAWADLVTINTAKVAAEAELAALVTALGFDTRDPMIGRTHAERATEMVKRYDDLAAELAAANARCAELDRDVKNVTRWAMTRESERDALQATLDRVGEVYGFLMRKYADPDADAATVLAVTRTSLRAALTPEGKREGEKAMPDKTEGLIHNKFYVQRTDNETNRKHDDCRYFVLDPQHDRLALFALATYAHEALDAGYTALGNDLIAWVRQIEDAETLEGKP